MNGTESQRTPDQVSCETELLDTQVFSGSVKRGSCGPDFLDPYGKWWANPLGRYMDVSKNSGTPKWMVKIMENPIKMDDLGVPLFLETPIYPYINQPHSYTSCHVCPWVPWCHSKNLLELEISWSEKPWCVVSLWTSRHPFAVFLSILCNFPPIPAVVPSVRHVGDVISCFFFRWTSRGNLGISVF